MKAATNEEEQVQRKRHVLDKEKVLSVEQGRKRKERGLRETRGRVKGKR